MSGSVVNFINKGILKKEEFLASGTFVVPSGVTRVMIEGCGGGGGGAGGPANLGGGGAPLLNTIVDVTPLASIVVTVGAGGAGGAAAGGGTAGDGLNGGTSSFGTVNMRGGRGATVASNQDYIPGGARGGTASLSAEDTVRFERGVGVGAGGAGYFGNGATKSGQQGLAGGANTGAGGAGSSNTALLGGNGGSGRIIVYYFQP